MPGDPVQAFNYLRSLMANYKRCPAWSRLTAIICILYCRRVWDALTGDELHSFEHKHIVRTCAFSEVCNRILNLKTTVF